MRQLLTAIILVTAGLVVSSMGLGTYLAKLYPNLDNGVSHILIGIVLVIIAILYTKMSD